MFTADTVTVVTAATGHRHLGRCVESVGRQTFAGVRHWVVADGPGRDAAVRAAVCAVPTGGATVVTLPEATGLDNWNGHRIYAAASFLVNTAFVCFLDEDNFFEPDHVASLVAAVRATPGGRWAFALRNVVDADGAFVCRDECESLGSLHPPFNAPGDGHVDANCYLLGRELAVLVAPLWYGPTRPGGGRPEPDRAVARALLARARPACTNRRHTVNYTAGNRPDSVPAEFFRYGNEAMRWRYPGGLPWL